MKFHIDDSLKNFSRHFGIDKLTDTDFEELKLNTISALKQYATDTGSDVVALEFYRGQLTYSQAQDLLEYLHSEGYKCDDGYISYGYCVTLKVRWGDSGVALQKPFELFLAKYTSEIRGQNQRRNSENNQSICRVLDIP
jgi:hypothetical protein